jgi:hypothetical protein
MIKLAKHARAALAALVVLGALALPTAAPAASDGSGKVHGHTTAQTAITENVPFFLDIGRRWH